MATNTRAKKSAPKQPIPHDDRLQYVYTDSKGNNWYQFASDLEMPYKRYITAQVQERLMTYGLTATTLSAIAKSAIDLAADPKQTPENLRKNLMVIGQNIEQRLGFMTGEDTYMQLAGVYYLLEGEPVNVTSAGWTQKKKDIWAEDEACKDFFLQGAFVKMQKLATISPEDIKSYFPLIEQREAAIPTLSGV